MVNFEIVLLIKAGIKKQQQQKNHSSKLILAKIKKKEKYDFGQN